MAARATVSIPATSANLGPGFDCLGLALDLRNEIHFEVADGLEVEIRGEGSGSLPEDADNIAVQAAERVFAMVGRRPPGMKLLLHNRIPVGSGLGSSAAAVVGGILGAAALVDSPFRKSDVLGLAAEMEGHPDNVAPALHGGLTLVVPDGIGFLVEPLPVAGLTVVVVLPDVHLPTARARAALPAHVPLADAVFNIGRAGLLLSVLRSGDFRRLRWAIQDRLHQPYRLDLIPGMARAFDAAYEAGADGVALSGAGPSLVALARANHSQIEQAIIEAFAAEGLNSRGWILPITQRGAVVSVTN
jgi:homoserine kinase